MELLQKQRVCLQYSCFFGTNLRSIRFASRRTDSTSTGTRWFFFVTMPFDELILHFSFPFLAVSGFGFLLKPSAYSVLNNKQAAHIFWPAKGRQGWRKKDPRANSDSDEGRRKRPCLPLLTALFALPQLRRRASTQHDVAQRAYREGRRTVDSPTTRAVQVLTRRSARCSTTTTRHSQTVTARAQ